MLPLVDLVPQQAMQVLDVCLSLYRIHPKYAMDGSGAVFLSRYKRWQDGTAPHNWERHDGFAIHWGLRPIGVERAGQISLSAEWIMRGRAKDYSFKGFALGFAFPGHTLQHGLIWWNGNKDAKYAKLIELLEGEIAQRFIDFECVGSCSHKDPTLRAGEVLTRPGLDYSEDLVFGKAW